jgi:hypothetical protein
MLNRMLVAAVLFTSFIIPSLAHDAGRPERQEHHEQYQRHEGGGGLRLPFGIFNYDQNPYCYDRYGNPYQCDE